MIDWWLLACILAAFMAVRSLIQLAIYYYRVQFHFILAKQQNELQAQIELLQIEQAKIKLAELTAQIANKTLEPAKTPAQTVSTAKKAA